MFESKIWKIAGAIGGMLLGVLQLYDSGAELAKALKEPEKSEETPEQNEGSK